MLHSAASQFFRSGQPICMAVSPDFLDTDHRPLNVAVAETFSHPTDRDDTQTRNALSHPVEFRPSSVSQ